MRPLAPHPCRSRLPGAPRPPRHAGPSLPALLLALVLTGCGGAVSGPSPVAPSPAPGSAGSGEAFPVDPAGPHYHPVHHAIFGPWYGSGCPAFGNCGCDGARTLAEESSCQLQHLATSDIPISVYLFDGNAWSQASSVGTDSCSGPDCCSWALGDGPLQALQGRGVRALLHFWGGCHTTEQYQRAESRLGPTLLGFYLDDGAADAELQQVDLSMQSLRPGDWENVAKTYQVGQPTLSDAAVARFANAAYVADLHYGFQGLRKAVNRVVSKAPLVPAPFAEFTGYAGGDPGAPEEEVYRRRLHFGALQPVMAHTPFANADPWSPQYSPDLLSSYRFWAWLHRELIPYFYSYAYRMFEDQAEPVIRQGDNPYSLLVGDELYVPVVTDYTASLDIQLPPGQWIDYWDESQVLSGLLAGFPVPVGREPIFVRRGALLPLDVERPFAGHGSRESAGALTVLVYPGDQGTFRYRPDARHPWVTLSASRTDTQLSLGADPPPPQPILYRVERWPTEPTSVSAQGSRVTVNQGGSLPRLGDEAAVNGSSQPAWFYDPAAQRLIVKAVP